jgi:hypothetical protein
MQGAVRWDALVIIGTLLVFAGSAAAVSAWLTYKACLLIGALEKRITRLEILAERTGVKSVRN